MVDYKEMVALRQKLLTPVVESDTDDKSNDEEDSDGSGDEARPLVADASVPLVRHGNIHSLRFDDPMVVTLGKSVVTVISASSSRLRAANTWRAT